MRVAIASTKSGSRDIRAYFSMVDCVATVLVYANSSFDSRCDRLPSMRIGEVPTVVPGESDEGACTLIECRNGHVVTMNFSTVVSTERLSGHSVSKWDPVIDGTNMEEASR